jgi:hypothetical protein
MADETTTRVNFDVTFALIWKVLCIVAAVWCFWNRDYVAAGVFAIAAK